jgi:hypothetical protein
LQSAIVLCNYWCLYRTKEHKHLHYSSQELGEDYDQKSTGPVNVGWFIDTKRSSVLFDAPTRVHSRIASREHAKSASRCPAAVNVESRYFEVKCPFDISVAFFREKNGRPNLRNLSVNKSSIRANELREVLLLTEEVEWRFKDRPTLQLSLPYVFVSDELVYMSQLPPFLHYSANPWPGTQFCGRFPINIWLRQIFWAFEWHDISKPLILTRGEPLFYLNFETLPQNRPVQLVEAEKTKELEEYANSMAGVAAYVNQTFSLFKNAEERRPKKLLIPKER